MPKLMSTLVLGISTAAASSAGLILTATPDQATYSSGGSSAGTLALAVDLDAMPTGSIQFVTGPALSAAPITISFVDQAGSTSPLLCP